MTAAAVACRDSTARRMYLSRKSSKIDSGELSLCTAGSVRVLIDRRGGVMVWPRRMTPRHDRLAVSYQPHTSEHVSSCIDMHAAERTCPVGQHECAGEYNRGVCEAGGVVGGGGAPNDSGDRHMGLEDEPFLPAAGDFFLISSAALHRMGGYHQVPRRASLCACMPSRNMHDCVHVCL